MTERALPQVGIGVRPRHVVDGTPRPVAVPRPGTAARPAVARKEAILTTPARAGMLFGASAAIYAVTLAGISGLQAQSEADVAAARAPYVSVVAEARAANDALETRLAGADAQLRALVADYGMVGEDVTAYQTRLDSLAVLVAEVQGSASALPARIKLPSVSMAGAIAGRNSGASSGSGRTSAPRTTTRTKASGR